MPCRDDAAAPVNPARAWAATVAARRSPGHREGTCTRRPPRGEDLLSATAEGGVECGGALARTQGARIRRRLQHSQGLPASPAPSGEGGGSAPLRDAPGPAGPARLGAPGLLEEGEGKRRSVWGFVLTLGYSRAMVAEIALDQRLETLLALREEAFPQLGGVPREKCPFGSTYTAGLLPTYAYQFTPSRTGSCRTNRPTSGQ